MQNYPILVRHHPIRREVVPCSTSPAYECGRGGSARNCLTSPCWSAGPPRLHAAWVGCLNQTRRYVRPNCAENSCRLMFPAKTSRPRYLVLSGSEERRYGMPEINSAVTWLICQGSRRKTTSIGLGVLDQHGTWWEIKNKGRFKYSPS
jgi:hypothetical protein